MWIALFGCFFLIDGVNISDEDPTVVSQYYRGLVPLITAFSCY